MGIESAGRSVPTRKARLGAVVDGAEVESGAVGAAVDRGVENVDVVGAVVEEDTAAAVTGELNPVADGSGEVPDLGGTVI